MKKLLFCLAFILFAPVVKAGSYSISASSTNVKVGETVKINVNVSGGAGKFSASSNSGVLSLSDKSNKWIDNTSDSFSFTANDTGSATITINPIDVAGYDGNEITGSKSITISVSSSSNSGGGSSGGGSTTKTYTKQDTKKDSNNKLEEFGVAGYDISPEYSNDVNDYKLTVGNDVKTIKIYATRSTSKATVSGLGEKEVSVGENKFEVTVTAENGDKRTLNLVVTVEDKPVVVKIDNKEYNVVKNKDELPKLELEHEDMTLTIQDQEVPAYRIDSIGYVLIGLRDSDGKVNLYKFDSFKNDEKEPTYNLFNYIEGNKVLLINGKFKKNQIPKNYKKYTEKINGTEYVVYKLNKKSKYCLLYGINIETGKENIYKYDLKEKTLQIYDNEEQKELTKEKEKYEKLILILAGVVVFLVLLTTIGFTRKQKVKDKEKDDDFLTKKDIKKIEKETKKEDKKNKKQNENIDMEFLSKKEIKKEKKKGKKKNKIEE